MDGGIYSIPFALFSTLPFLIFKNYIKIFSVSCFIGIIIFCYGFDILFLKLLIILSLIIFFLSLPNNKSYLLGIKIKRIISKCLPYWMILLLFLTLIFYNLSPEIGIMGTRRLTPLGVDPNNFSWVLVLFSAAGIQSRFFLLYLVAGQSLSAGLIYLLRNSLKLLLVLFISIVILYIFSYTYDSENYFEGYNQYMHERMLSLWGRAARTLSAFSGEYVYEGLNPHTSVAAGYLKIGVFSIVYSALVIFILYKYNKKLSIVLAIASIFVDVFFSQIGFLLPFLLIISMKNILTK